MAHLNPLPNIMEAVQGIHYPADANRLLARAQANGAAPTTLKLLGRLPDDREYRSVTEVNHALGEIEGSDLQSDRRIHVQNTSNRDFD